MEKEAIENLSTHHSVLNVDVRTMRGWNVRHRRGAACSAVASQQEVFCLSPCL